MIDNASATGPERVFEVPEVARHLGTSNGTVYGLIQRGSLRSVRVGRLLRVTESALQEFLSGHEPVRVD